MRNLLAFVPKTGQSLVGTMVRQVLVQPDAASARKAWPQVADEYRGRFPKAATLMDSAEADVLAHLEFPAAHRVKLHSTNTLEHLHAKLDRVLAGRRLTVADLPRLPCMRAVFDETLRLFWPVAAMVRRTARDVMLWDRPIAKDTVLMIALYNIHRHPDFWVEPERFRPERFLADGEKPKHRLAYMPFSAGPCVCVGNHFALTEGPLLIASIAQRCEFRLHSGNQPVEPELRVTVKPKGGLRMSVYPRRKV